MWRRIIVFLLVASLGPSVARAACLSPVGPFPNSASEWDDLSKHDRTDWPETLIEQDVASGTGDIYLSQVDTVVDEVTTDSDLFAEIKRHLFSQRGPIGGRIFSLGPSDADSAELWSSDDPIGSVIRSTVLNAQASLLFEFDDFVVTCADATSLIFTSATSSFAGSNTLSGSWGIGVLSDPTGAARVYIKRAERLRASRTDTPNPAQADWILSATRRATGELLATLVRVRNPDSLAVIDTHVVNVPAASTPSVFETPEELDAFSSGLREVTRVGAGPHVKIDTGSVEALLSGISPEGDSDPGSLSRRAFLMGVLYSATYNAKLSEMLEDRFPSIGLANANYTFAGSGVLVSSDLGQGYSLTSLALEQPLLAAKIGLSRSQQRLLDHGIGRFLSEPDPLKLLSSKLDDALRQVASDAVKSKLDELKEAAIAEVVAFVAEQLDVDPETARLILELRKQISDAKGLKAQQLLTLKNIGNVVFTVLLWSGQCLCIPPKCSYFEAICTGYYVVQKFSKWDPDWRKLTSLIADLALEEPYLTAAKVAAYADKVQEAIAKFRELENLAQVPRAAEDLRSAVATIAAINWPSELKQTISAHQQLLFDAPIRRSNVMPGLCTAAATRNDLEEQSCALARASRKLSVQTQRIVQSLRTLREGLLVVLGEDGQAIIDDAVALASSVSEVSRDVVEPAVDSLYSTLNSLHEVARLPGVGDLQTQIEELIGAHLGDWELQRRASELAELNETARRAGQEALDGFVSRRSSGAVALAEVRTDRSYSSIVEEILELYAPYQNREDILNRLTETKSAFMFFRQFPPLFYKRALVALNSEPDMSGLLDNANTYRAWTVGDPHLQNFGTHYPVTFETLGAFRETGPLNRSGAIDPCSPTIGLKIPVTLVMNDPDDGGEGAPLLDLLRFITGLEIHRPGILKESGSELIAAYLAGVRKEEHVLSEVTSQALKGAEPKIQRCKFVSTFDAASNFRKRSDEGDRQIDLTDDEMTEANRLVREFFRADATVVSAYKYERLKGGSGANWRWELIAQAPPYNEGYWIEVKGLGIRPGNFPASDLDYGWPGAIQPAHAAAEAMNRYRSTLLATYGPNAITSFKVVNTADGPALLRYRLSGQGSFRINGLSSSQLVGLAKDELYELGQVHRRGFLLWLGEDVSWSDYGNEIASLTTSATALAERMARSLTSDYEQVVAYDGRFTRFLKELRDPSTEELEKLEQLVDVAEDRSEWVEQQSLEEDELLPAETEQDISLMVREVNFAPRQLDCAEQVGGIVDRNQLEFISFVNASDKDFDTSQLQLDVGNLIDISSMKLSPGQLLVVSRSTDSIRFRYVFPEGTVYIQSDKFALSKRGERVRVRRLGPSAGVLLDFHYDSAWLDTAPGLAESIVSIASLPEFWGSFSDPDVADEMTAQGLQPNFKDSVRLVDFSLGSSWQPTSHPTRQQRAQDLAPSFVMFYAKGGKKHDFIILENVGRFAVELGELRILGTQLTGSVEPGQFVALVKDEMTFRGTYKEFSGRVIEYKAGLDDVSDKFQLECIQEDTKDVWELSYDASVWSDNVRGQGSGLLPKNLCIIPEKTISDQFWREGDVIPPPHGICSADAIGLCGTRLVGERWEVIGAEGAVEFECIQTDRGATPIPTDSSCPDDSPPGEVCPSTN